MRWLDSIDPDSFDRALTSNASVVNSLWDIAYDREAFGDPTGVGYAGDNLMDGGPAGQGPSATPVQDTGEEGSRDM